MELESTTLYFREGASDKVYQARIVKEPGDRFRVTFAYGRRGGTLATGSKTPQPVGLDDARTIFQKLVREKQAKGYTPGEDGTPYTAPGASAPAAPRLLPQLLNTIDESEVPALIRGSGWWMQEKHDGRRMLLAVESAGVVGFNKTGQPCGVPEPIVRLAQLVGDYFLVDGEAVGDVFHVFDILEFGGKDLRPLSYAARLGWLEDFMRPIRATKPGDSRDSAIRLSPTAKNVFEKRQCFEQAKADNCEGVVFKDSTAPYTPGRPNSGGPQRKFKFVESASCIVAFVNAKRSVGLWLLDDAKVAPGPVAVGNVTIPPNHAMPREGDIIEVRYLYAYPGGSLYQPVYLGVRDDTDRAECTLAQLKFKTLP